jgi:hypothetical protein
MQGDNRESKSRGLGPGHPVYAEKILVAAQIQFKFHDNASMLKKNAPRPLRSSSYHATRVDSLEYYFPTLLLLGASTAVFFTAPRGLLPVVTPGEWLSRVRVWLQFPRVRRSTGILARLGCILSHSCQPEPPGAECCLLLPFIDFQSHYAGARMLGKVRVRML